MWLWPRNCGNKITKFDGTTDLVICNLRNKVTKYCKNIVGIKETVDSNIVTINELKSPLYFLECSELTSSSISYQRSLVSVSVLIAFWTVLPTSRDPSCSSSSTYFSMSENTLPPRRPLRRKVEILPNNIISSVTWPTSLVPKWKRRRL